MTNPHGQPDDSAREKRLLEALRCRPELLERFEAILALTQSEEGPLRSADEIEEFLVEEVRRLGNRAMHDWAQGAEARAAEDLRKTQPKARLRKKSPELVVRLRRGLRSGAALARSGGELSASVCGGGQSQRTGQMAPPATRALRFRCRGFLCARQCAAAGALRLCPQRLGRAGGDAAARRPRGRPACGALRAELPRAAPQGTRAGGGRDRWDHDLHGGGRPRTHPGTPARVEGNAPERGPGARECGNLPRSRVQARRGSRSALGPLRARCRLGAGKPHPRRG